MKKIFGALASCLFAGSLLNAQETQWTGSVEGFGMISTDSELPFWAHTNTFGRVEKESSFYLLGTVKAHHDFARWGFLEFGAGALVNNGGEPNARADHYYVKYENYWFGIVAGKEQPDPDYNGLSAASPSYMFTNNARPLPGIKFYTPRPLLLDDEGKWQLEADWGEYVLDDDRAVNYARVHTKQVNVIYNFDERNQVQGGFQHVGLWDGNWPLQGDFFSGLADYTTVWAGARQREASKGTTSGVAGNWDQMATYMLRYRRVNKNYDFELFWDHFFEDGSGLRLGNFPDGRWGFYVQNKREEPMWDNFLYEFYYTRNQSDRLDGNKGNDNYFTHPVYSTGWTYHNRVIGVPFYLSGDNGEGIISNRFIVHHFGVDGFVGTVPYAAKLSYRRNYGLKDIPYTGPKVIVSGMAEVFIDNSFLPFKLYVAGDYSEEKSVGAMGVSLRKEF